MKSGLSVFVVFVGLFLFSGCKDANTGIVIPENVGKYPFASGSEWNYNYKTIVSFYDDHGQIVRDSVFEESNVAVRVFSLNDSLPNLPHLIKIETFSQTYPNAKGIIWYNQTDSALYWVAYNNTGAVPWVFPSKENNGIEVL